MKANFKINKNNDNQSENIKSSETSLNKTSEISEEEFENFVSKAGAAGTFMVFRSNKKKEDELGIEELAPKLVIPSN